MSDVKPVPDDYTAITPYLVAEDAPRLLDFLAEGFGAVERMRMPMPDGSIAHAEVEIGGAPIMLGSANAPDFPPLAAQIHLYVDDVDAVYAQAVSAGATPVAEPEDQFYGDRIARVLDTAGNHWSIATHIADVTEEEMAQAMEAMGEG
ncbi:MAG: VOC family protein [Dehalococcoidia bacterium]|nr:VOC family protein [Dehalococcoidia bacterium]MYA52601.1 VOC family protein [Dehalococcoidia bacterium]